MNLIPTQPTQTKAPSTRDVLSALMSFSSFYEQGLGYSTLGRAAFCCLRGKLTQRDSMRVMVVRSHNVGRRAAQQQMITEMVAECESAPLTWDGPAQVYTPPARRLGGNVRRREGDVRISPAQQFIIHNS
jgi:hypothetical protein